MAAAPYIERMAPASWPLFCRNCARVTADMAGIATASMRPATHRATPISISVMPRSMCLFAGSGRALPAVNGDVVAAALGFVGSIGVDVVAFAGADVGVVGPPRILVQVLDVFRYQLLETVGPLAGLDVVEVDAVRDRLQIQRRRPDLRLFQLVEDVVADGAGDEAEDDQHDHDLDQRHAARRSPRLASPFHWIPSCARREKWGHVPISGAFRPVRP